MADSIVIVLADDSDIARKYIRRLLASEEGMNVAAEAADGQEAVRLVRELAPEVVILDFHMPLLNGIEAARVIGQLPSPPKVVMLTIFSPDQLVFKAFEAGCVAYVLKSSIDELAEAVYEAQAKRFFVSASLRHLQPELEARFRC